MLGKKKLFTPQWQQTKVTHPDADKKSTKRIVCSRFCLKSPDFLFSSENRKISPEYRLKDDNLYAKMKKGCPTEWIKKKI
jgi:hypothetical protein